MSLKFSYNVYAYQWSFPEIVAYQSGYYQQQSLDFELSTFGARRGVNKNVAYEELLKTGRTDIYHAGEWACIIRVLEDRESCITGASYPDSHTLNSTFSIYVRSDSGITDIRQLENRTVAIEYGTGSYFTALQDMLGFLNQSQIKLVQVGSPHLRLLALFNGAVAAASLIHPWNELAEVVGMKKLLETNRQNPTLAVTRRSVDGSDLHRFFNATNHAIDDINDDFDSVRESYVSNFMSIAATLPGDLRSAAFSLRDTIDGPKWKHWQTYPASSFRKAVSFLGEYSLINQKVDYQELIHPAIGSIF